MDTLHFLHKEEKRLQRIITETSARIASSPEGCLEIDLTRGTPHYRHNIAVKGSKKHSRHYLGTNDLELIQNLAQKGYDVNLLKAALKQHKVLSVFLSQYDPQALKKIYEDLSPARRLLIRPEELDDDTFIQRWEAVTYAPGEFAPTDPEFYAMRGERVRSKSEKIIADTLLATPVPYRYEPPLTIIKGQKPWRPDFLVLNKRTRKEYIWEHLGKMDDEDYCKKNIRKLETYLQQGFFIGETLLVTMETSENPLSTKIIDAIIDKYLK